MWYNRYTEKIKEKGGLPTANRIFVTGDCHGDYSKFSAKRFPEQKNLTHNDFVIVTGDFGYWDNSPEQRYWRKWLSGKPFTTLFVDGNHENFDMLNTLPVEEWHGGKVHKISDNIIHLMRGQSFDIGGKTWFTMGGAPSHDIQDGILDPADEDFRKDYFRLTKQNKMFRILGVSWWKEELPSKEEYETAEKTLQDIGYKADFILTHEAPVNVVFQMSNGQFKSNELSRWLEKEIEGKTEFTKWFFGHYHQDMQIGNHICFYNKITELDIVSQEERK